jgi:hypothetical protein
MIIGLERVAIILFISFIALWIIGLVIHRTAERLSVMLVVLAVVCEIACGVFAIGLISAQNNVEEHYVDYLKLQVQVAKYDDLDMLEQYKVDTDVMTYNLWYERNKSDLKNEWSFKGSSDYAKEFNYIVIGG